MVPAFVRQLLQHPSSRAGFFVLFSYASTAFTFSTSPPRFLLSTRFLSSSQKLRASLLDGSSLNAKEQIQIVDPLTNEPLPTPADRAAMRLNRLCHRATYIFLVRPSDNKLFVQRRSAIKDYCPNYLDPTPGGVVGFGESYELNVQRELEEEMGLSPTHTTLKRMFTFHYEDDQTDCWGEAYEAKWEGSPADLKLQEAEVSEVLMLSLDEIIARDNESRESKFCEDKFTQDSMHALRLYKQFKDDSKKPNQKYRNLDDFKRYTLRAPVTALFCDLDDCLYFDGWKVANRLTEKIEVFCTKKLSLPQGKAYELYKQHGTALQGLLREEIIPNTPKSIDEYLEFAHDIDADSILSPNPTLRELLLSIDPSIPKYIFTASVKSHAITCLKKIGILDLFEDRIIDTKVCDLHTKHDERSFHAAMKFAGITDSTGCVLLDDSTKNIDTARRMGWRPFLVGVVGRDDGKMVECTSCEAAISRITELKSVLPEIFYK
jgi:putative hydrolase of the HAD superfamily/pyrimidine and pyridine-specific 5'-nucleotidase